MRINIFRISTVALLLPTLALALAACGGGGGDENAEPTPQPTTTGGEVIPTATPFAILPDPIIVTGDDAVAAGADSSPVTYVVEAGDTLSGIADRYDTTVDAIMAENGLTDPTKIFIDQELVIPGPNVLASSSPEPSDGGGATASETGLTTYVVQAGDTALGIAFQFDVTLEELAAANGMTVEALNSLNVGDELVIPS